ncbi:YgjP-like metallopeptidase domain-containing protein [Crenobacter caeni]|uniref:M48 family metallopeptidase n=1 Tax=Crenobacter caeni TaxID=2705474 RepID=A0A6B2KVY8_9NEIS|nr:YgjP-like metallopeptidase domain-containing protein [Crenobacter caeni]NDV14341.1 M48 family metallopeptidase [Crenobacter caeni]
MTGSPTLKYLAGYPEPLQQQAQTLLAAGTLGELVASKYPGRHTVQSDKALFEYAQALRQRYLKTAPPLSKVLFDNRLDLVRGTLGLQTRVARVQGSRLQRKHEIRVAALFRDAPEAFLRVIVVHELAHLKEGGHDKAFYQLCRHMEPDYHQLEFDMRLWLTVKDP